MESPANLNKQDDVSFTSKTEDYLRSMKYDIKKNKAAIIHKILWD